MNVQITNTTPSAPVAPYAVDVSQGAVRGDVSAQWASRPSDQRFDTLGDLYDFKRDLWEKSLDVRLKSNSLDFIAPPMPSDDEIPDQAMRHAEARRRMGLLKVGFATVQPGADVQSVMEVSPTHWAFGQLSKLGGAPASYLRTLPTEIVKDNLNWGLSYNREVEEVKLFTTTSELMAAQGPTYGRIGDHEVVRACMAIAGQGKGADGHHWKAPGRLNWSDGTYDPEALGPKDDRTFYGSDRDVFIFLVDDRRPIVVGKTRDGADDVMFRGFYVQNSMVGSRSLKLSTFYLRGVCMNRNLWGVERFSEVVIRHTAGAPERWLQEVQPALEQYAQASDVRLIEGVEKAKARMLVEKDESAIKFLQARSYSANTAKTMLDKFEADEGRKARSVWDFGNAITAFAQTRRNTDDRLDDELKAKGIFDLVS